ncbi:MAG: hypothetical protein ACPG8W_25860 [Candidatus Promineifilaceae bacterium]
MTVKEQVLTRLELLPQEKLPSLLDYIEYLYFQSKKDEKKQPAPATESYDALNLLLDDCAVSTGISDLAAEHDHYLYGKDKHAV